MPKRISRPKRLTEINQLTYELVKESTEEKREPTLSRSDISHVMAEMGRRGGKIGGKRLLRPRKPGGRRKSLYLSDNQTRAQTWRQGTSRRRTGKIGADPRSS